MKDDGRQHVDEFTPTGKYDGRGAFGTRWQFGVGEIWRGAAFAEFTSEVCPPRDAAVNHEGRLVGVRRTAKEDAGSQQLVACGQVQR
jgi:hypothetical protein